MNFYDIFYSQYYLDMGFTCADKVVVNIVGQNHIGRINNRLLGATFTDNIRLKQSNCIVNPDHGFKLEVAYPGLITGVGINHEVGGVDSEFKLGMHFDYTTGMPVIYGSTVKGVLKSYIKHYDVGVDSLDLEKEIFEGLKRTDNGGDIPEKERTYEPMSIYDRDIFFDAVIVQGTRGSKFLEKDTICPHGDNPLKNPTPINFLKIAPGVKIEFRFNLKGKEDRKENGYLISTIQKIALFKEILQDWGIGAKTNVGYGQFVGH